MKNNPAKTIAGRRKLWRELRQNLDSWMLMSHDVLLKEARKGFPNIIEATREELLTMLIMDHTDKMVGG